MNENENVVLLGRQTSQLLQIVQSHIEQRYSDPPLGPQGDRDAVAAMVDGATRTVDRFRQLVDAFNVSAEHSTGYTVASA